MAALLERMAEAGWIKRSLVDGDNVQVEWTLKGRAHMESLCSGWEHLGRLPGDQMTCLQLLLLRLLERHVETGKFAEPDSV
jgi:hypothetical protein